MSHVVKGLLCLCREYTVRGKGRSKEISGNLMSWLWNERKRVQGTPRFLA